MERLKEPLLNYLMLFSSVGTLVCCALPSLLVGLGLGAVMAGLAANVPGLIWISENKDFVFLAAGIFLASNGFLMWKNRNAPCPIEPKLREACLKGRSFSQKIYFVSLSFFIIGSFYAYIAPEIFL